MRDQQTGRLSDTSRRVVRVSDNQPVSEPRQSDNQEIRNQPVSDDQKIRQLASVRAQYQRLAPSVIVQQPGPRGILLPETDGNCGNCDSATDSERSTDWTALAWKSTILVVMTGPEQSSAIAAYQSQANSMRRSHDENGSIQMNMDSLGVIDLDLSSSPDVFGLRAFDATKPVTRMLTRSSPCELRLMLPDDKLSLDGFHDILVENLSGTPAWRSSHVSPADMTSLRYGASAPGCPETSRQGVPLWRSGFPGFCGVCNIGIYSALDAHMIATHLELGQLWRCPVTWCAVWKGSGRACLEHLAENHGGSENHD